MGSWKAPGITVPERAAAVGEALELRQAPIEVVVADPLEVEPQPVHRENRWLVHEQVRDERAGSGEVSRGDDDRVRILGTKSPDMCGEVRDAARGDEEVLPVRRPACIRVLAQDGVVRGYRDEAAGAS